LPSSYNHEPRGCGILRCPCCLYLVEKPVARDADVFFYESMPGFNRAYRERGSIVSQNFFQRSAPIPKGIGSAIHQKHRSVRPIRPFRLLFENLLTAQKNRRANHMRVKAHECSQQISAVGVTDKRRPAQVDAISGGGALDKSLERLCFKTDVGLIEFFQIEAAKPALDTLFRAA